MIIIELVEDMMNMHGVDVQSEMVNIMSYEIQAEIDRQLLGEMVKAAIPNPKKYRDTILERFMAQNEDRDLDVQKMLEIWRDLLFNEFPDAELEFDLEYITVDGTTNEYDDRGLDFDIVSNTK